MSLRIACVLLMLVALPTAPALAGTSPRSVDSLSLRATRAELRKTNAESRRAGVETKKLERDNGWWARLLSYLAPFLTAATAAAGVFVSVRKVGEDRREARESAEIERFDERFAKAVEGLSSVEAGRGERCGRC